MVKDINNNTELRALCKLLVKIGIAQRSEKDPRYTVEDDIKKLLENKGRSLTDDL